jgi:AcrR family transcriptional regulator
MRHARRQQRRSYDSPLRQERAAQTRERIIAAGAKIAHRLPTWDWREVTFKAVGARARVSERTVHRYFSSERKLRDAILQRLVEESGVTLDGMELSDFAKVVARVYEYLASFAVAPANVEDPTFAALDQRRRKALLAAVVQATRGWSESDQEMAAAMLDMLWNVNAYERMMTTWRLDKQRAIQANDWMIGLIERAIQQGMRPSAGQ